MLNLVLTNRRPRNTMGNVSLPVPAERKRPCINIPTQVGGVCSSDRGDESYMKRMGHSDCIP